MNKNSFPIFIYTYCLCKEANNVCSNNYKFFLFINIRDFARFESRTSTLSSCMSNIARNIDVSETFQTCAMHQTRLKSGTVQVGFNENRQLPTGHRNTARQGKRNNPARATQLTPVRAA